MFNQNQRVKAALVTALVVSLVSLLICMGVINIPFLKLEQWTKAPGSEGYLPLLTSYMKPEVNPETPRIEDVTPKRKSKVNKGIANIYLLVVSSSSPGVQEPICKRALNWVMHLFLTIIILFFWCFVGK